MSDELQQQQLFPEVPEKLEEAVPAEEEKGETLETTPQTLPESQLLQEQPQPSLSSPAAHAESQQPQPETAASNVSPQQSAPQEYYEEYFHDPWQAVTTPAPTASVPNASPSSLGSASPPVARSSRFTRGRIVAFAAVCLAVVVAFGGGAVALVNAARPTTPAQQPPIQRSTTVQARPTMAVTPTAPAAAATTPAKNMLKDDFHRTNMTGGWGTASTGQQWTITTPQRAGAFSIVDNVGVISSNQVGPAYYTAVLGPSFQDGEVTATFTLPPFDERQTNSGVILHWQDANNYDKAYADGVQLVLLENRNGTQTTLTQLAFPALDDGTTYTLRFRAVGKTLMAKAWVSQKQEPPTWMLQSSDTKLTTGQAGVRARLQVGNQMKMQAFQISV